MFIGTRLGACACMHTLANVSALRTPGHFSGGCGSFQRNGPTGGAANGIPLNTRTPDFRVTPESRPLAVLTGSEIAASALDTDRAAMAAAARSDRNLIGA